MADAPILRDNHPDAPSEVTPESLLREARRQKDLPQATVPAICVFDPDGDIVRYLRSTGLVTRDPNWACYHSELNRLVSQGQEFGIVGCAVSGCELLVSVTSSGQITPLGAPPYFILIDKALRDEGMSYHYLPPAEFSSADERLIDAVWSGLSTAGERVERGATWTTDAPFRGTETAIAAARSRGILAVETEAAALYAFAQARAKPDLCFAHVTNQMGRSEGDFEKGEANGAIAAIRLITGIAQSWPQHREAKNRPDRRELRP